MHSLSLPAGSRVRLHATAGAEVGQHRWAIRVLEAGAPRGGLVARLAYGSQIGAGDCEQRVDIPAQDVDCRIEVDASHASATGWKDDRSSIEEDTPNCLQIGFSDRALAFARSDDVLLSFTFVRRDTIRADDAPGAR
jgi:hypothetical protein